MKSVKEQAEESLHLKCDNDQCDWKNHDITFENIKDWINKPCPKCGQNVLTQDDYNRTMIVKNAIDFADSLNIQDNEGPMLKMTIGTHERLDVSLEKLD